VRRSGKLHAKSEHETVWQDCGNDIKKQTTKTLLSRANRFAVLARRIICTQYHPSGWLAVAQNSIRVWPKQRRTVDHIDCEAKHIMSLSVQPDDFIELSICGFIKPRQMLAFAVFRHVSASVGRGMEMRFWDGGPSVFDESISADWFTGNTAMIDYRGDTTPPPMLKKVRQ